MFFFAWQLTVVNRNETKQRKQGSEVRLLSCPLTINYGIYGFTVEVIIWITFSRSTSFPCWEHLPLPSWKVYYIES